MATGEVVDKAVLEFAKDYATQRKVPPLTKWSDTINPAFSALSTEDFLSAFDTLKGHLARNNVRSNIGIEQVRACTTWRELSNTTFDEQPK